MARGQLPLFDAPPLARTPPRFDPTFARAERTELAHGAWVEHVPGWIEGDLALFDELERATSWHRETRVMYEKVVETPRLLGGSIRHPLLEAMRRALTERYGEDFVRVSVALYRDGRDSVALHGDTTARDML